MNLELKVGQTAENVDNLLGITNSFKLIADNISKICVDVEEVKSSDSFII